MADTVIITENEESPETDTAVEEIAEVAETAIENAAVVAAVAASEPPDTTVPDATTILVGAVTTLCDRLDSAITRLENATGSAMAVTEIAAETAETLEAISEAEGEEHEELMEITDDATPDIPPSNMRNRFKSAWRGK